MEKQNATTDFIKHDRLLKLKKVELVNIIIRNDAYIKTLNDKNLEFADVCRTTNLKLACKITDYNALSKTHDAMSVEHEDLIKEHQKLLDEYDSVITEYNTNITKIKENYKDKRNNYIWTIVGLIVIDIIAILNCIF